MKGDFEATLSLNGTRQQAIRNGLHEGRRPLGIPSRRYAKAKAVVDRQREDDLTSSIDQNRARREFVPARPSGVRPDPQ